MLTKRQSVRATGATVVDPNAVAAILHSSFSDDAKPRDAGKSLASLDAVVTLQREHAQNRHVLSTEGVSEAGIDRILKQLAIFSAGMSEVTQAVRAASPQAELVVANLWKSFSLLLDQCEPHGTRWVTRLAATERAHRTSTRSLLRSREQQLHELRARERELRSRVDRVLATIQKTQSMRQAIEEQRLGVSEDSAFQGAVLERLQQEVSCWSVGCRLLSSFAGALVSAALPATSADGCVCGVLLDCPAGANG